ncbi:MAG: hypothetical protein ABW130_19350 [Candidatus Thiodiazotropha lotti]
MKKILILAVALTSTIVTSHAYSVNLGEVVMSEDPQKRPDYKLLTIINGCQSGPTKDSGGRRDCHLDVRIIAPKHYVLLPSTTDITVLANKGEGHGCRKNEPTYALKNDIPYVEAVSVYANARSESGATVLALPLSLQYAASLFNGLKTEGAVLCKLSVTARKK